ncbi:MAG: hypothetical protein IJ193_04925 [Bacilli bacterium]|nr:hypothetical protein [Bacilli bacterium]
MGGYPIVSLDRIYLSPEGEQIKFLDCTRLDGSSDLVSRKNPNDLKNVEEQIKRLASKIEQKQIVLADDVVFSGNVLKSIIALFEKYGVKTLGIRSAISSTEGYEYFNSNLPLGLKCGYLLGDNIIDQICERDFYFGIAQSGISIRKDGEIVKAPYFKPYGNPVERASIPEEYEEFFSKGCIIRSLALWERIESLTGREILVRDLPEKINNTEESETVQNVLKKGLNYEKTTNRNNGISR